MKNFKQIYCRVDGDALLDRIASYPKLWDEVTFRQDFEGSPHKDTQAIIMRGPASLSYQDTMQSIACYDYPIAGVLKDYIGPALVPMLNALCITELGRVMIVKLKAGGHVTAHIDEGEYADHYARFHVALSTNEHCIQTSGDEGCHFPAGTAWWFDHKKTHTASNYGDTDRIHIIADAVTPFFPMSKQLRSDQ